MNGRTSESVIVFVQNDQAPAGYVRAEIVTYVATVGTVEYDRALANLTVGRGRSRFPYTPGPGEQERP